MTRLAEMPFQGGSRANEYDSTPVRKGGLKTSRTWGIDVPS